MARLCICLVVSKLICKIREILGRKLVGRVKCCNFVGMKRIILAIVCVVLGLPVWAALENGDCVKVLGYERGHRSSEATVTIRNEGSDEILTVYLDVRYVKPDGGFVKGEPVEVPLDEPLKPGEKVTCPCPSRYMTYAAIPQDPTSATLQVEVTMIDNGLPSMGDGTWAGDTIDSETFPDWALPRVDPKFDHWTYKVKSWYIDRAHDLVLYALEYGHWYALMVVLMILVAGLVKRVELRLALMDLLASLFVGIVMGAMVGMIMFIVIYALVYSRGYGRENEGED